MSRVLLVTGVFPPQIGGPATFIDQLGHLLVSRGHRVTVVCSSDTRRESSDQRRPFSVIRVHSAMWVRHQIVARWVLIREMLRHGVVLVAGMELESLHASQVTGRGYALRIGGDSVWEAARNAGLTALSSDEFADKGGGENDWIRRLVSHRTASVARAQVVVAVSESLMRRIVGWGVPPEKVQVVPNGLKLDEYKGYAAARRSRRLLEVVYVGRLTNFKGLETLLLAARDIEGVRLRIVGDGPEMPLLAGLALQLRPRCDMVFSGRLGGPALREALAISHVLVLPSLYDGHSNTLLEAGAMGLACVASDRGGNPEIITHEENGLLVPYGDVEALREALVRLRDNEDLRYGLACRAKENSKRFDIEQTVDRYMEIILS